VRLLVLGAAGIVGRASVAEALGRGWSVDALDRSDLDVAASAEVGEAIASRAPQLVINCAAFTRVDDCESRSDLAFLVNGHAVSGISAACSRAGARLIQLSSDYVFDGAAAEPYDETAATGPLSVYGASKLAGERHALEDRRHLVVRTSAVFGTGGANFVDAIAARLRDGQTSLRVVRDQVTSPTYAPFLARALADLGESGASGLVHYRNREPVSWYEFALAIARQLACDAEIVPVTTDEFPRPAVRPVRSVLAVGRYEAMVGRPVESWNTGLEHYLSIGSKERVLE
jgi:dTDP-4-dehydrorhamnose reductase